MSAQEFADLESLYADGVLDEDEYKTKLAELKPAKARTGVIMAPLPALDPRCSYNCPHGCGALNAYTAETCRQCGRDIKYDNEQRQRRALDPPVALEKRRSLTLCICCGVGHVSGDLAYLPGSDPKGPRSADYVCWDCQKKCPRCMTNEVLASGDGAHIVCARCLDDVLGDDKTATLGNTGLSIMDLVLDDVTLTDSRLVDYLRQSDVRVGYLVDREARRQVALRLFFRRSREGPHLVRDPRIKLPDNAKFFRGIPGPFLDGSAFGDRDPLDLLGIGEDTGRRFPSEELLDIFTKIHQHLKQAADAGADPLEISKRIIDVATAKNVVCAVASGLFMGRRGGRLLEKPFHAHHSVDDSICSLNQVGTNVGP